MHKTTGRPWARSAPNSQGKGIGGGNLSTYKLIWAKLQYFVSFRIWKPMCNIYDHITTLHLGNSYQITTCGCPGFESNPGFESVLVGSLSEMKRKAAKRIKTESNPGFESVLVGFLSEMKGKAAKRIKTESNPGFESVLGGFLSEMKSLYLFIYIYTSDIL